MNAADLRLGARWLVARLKLTLRNPRAVVFTLAFPLLLVVLFSGLNGNADVDAYGTTVRFAQFYTPAIAVFSLVTACYTTLVVGLATARDEGLLKRVRGTPLPMAIYLGAWVVGAMAVGIGAILLLFAVAVPAFDVHVYWHAVPAAVVTLLLGAGCFAALGLAAAALIPNGAAAPALLGLTFFPLALASGVFSGGQPGPAWLGRLTAALPMQPFAAALRAGFDPSAAGAGLATRQLETLLGWAVLGLLVARRRFRWEPPGTAA
jgi:ABC-2 type transport system permease protein